MSTKSSSRLREVFEYLTTEKKITQAEIARTLGVSPNYISDVKRGKRNSTSSVFIKLCQIIYTINPNWWS